MEVFLTRYHQQLTCLGAPEGGLSWPKASAASVASYNKYRCIINNNHNKRPLTPKSMPPTGDEHAKLKTQAPKSNAKRKCRQERYGSILTGRRRAPSKEICNQICMRNIGRRLPCVNSRPTISPADRILGFRNVALTDYYFI